MTEDEVKEFIESQKSLQVATINKDGTPHLSTLWFDLVDEQIVFVNSIIDQPMNYSDV